MLFFNLPIFFCHTPKKMERSDSKILGTLGPLDILGIFSAIR